MDKLALTSEYETARTFLLAAGLLLAVNVAPVSVNSETAVARADISEAYIPFDEDDLPGNQQIIRKPLPTA